MLLSFEHPPTKPHSNWVRMLVVWLLLLRIASVPSAQVVCTGAGEGGTIKGVITVNDRVEIRSDSVFVTDGVVLRPASCKQKASGCPAWESVTVGHTPKRANAMVALGRTFKNVSVLQKDAYDLLRGRKCGQARQVLLKSAALLLFPHLESDFVQEWHTALATPGALFRKPRLTLSGALMVAADCMFESSQVGGNMDGLETSYKMLRVVLAILKSDSEKGSESALKLVDRISDLLHQISLSYNEMHLKASQSHQNSNSNEGLNALNWMFDRWMDASDCGEGRVDENGRDRCINRALGHAVQLIPSDILLELGVEWGVREEGGELCRTGDSVLGGCYEGGTGNGSYIDLRGRGLQDCLWDVYRKLRVEGYDQKSDSGVTETCVDDIKDESSDGSYSSKVVVGEITKTKVCDDVMEGGLDFFKPDGWVREDIAIQEKVPRHVSGVRHVAWGYNALENSNLRTDEVGSEPWALPLSVEGGTVLRRDTLGFCGPAKCLGIKDLLAAMKKHEESDLEGFVEKITERYYTEIAGLLDMEIDLDNPGPDVVLNNPMDRMHIVNQEVAAQKAQEADAPFSDSKSRPQSPNMDPPNRRLPYAPDYYRKGVSEWVENEMESQSGWLFEVLGLSAGWVGGRSSVSFLGAVVCVFAVSLCSVVLYVYEPLDLTQSWAASGGFFRESRDVVEECASPNGRAVTSKQKKVERTPEVPHKNCDTIGAVVPNADTPKSGRPARLKKVKTKASGGGQKSGGEAKGKSGSANKSGSVLDENDSDTGWMVAGKARKGAGWQGGGLGDRAGKKSVQGVAKRGVSGVKQKAVVSEKAVNGPAVDAVKCSPQSATVSPPSTPVKLPVEPQKGIWTGKGHQSLPKPVAGQNGGETALRSVKSTAARFYRDSPKGVLDARKIQESAQSKSVKVGTPKRQQQHPVVAQSSIPVANAPQKAIRMEPVSPSVTLTSRDPAVPEPVTSSVNVAGVIGQLINHRNQIMDIEQSSHPVPSPFSMDSRYRTPCAANINHQHSLSAEFPELMLDPSMRFNSMPASSIAPPYPGVSMASTNVPVHHQRTLSVPGMASMMENPQRSFSGSDQQGRFLYPGQGSLGGSGRSIWSTDLGPSIWSVDNTVDRVRVPAAVSASQSPGSAKKLGDPNGDLKDKLPDSLLSDQYV